MQRRMSVGIDIEGFLNLLREDRTAEARDLLLRENPMPAVEPYIRRQGRFRHLTDEMIGHVQSETDGRWERLERRVNHGT